MSDSNLNNVFYFQWHITDACNLRCSHCYQENYSPNSELLLQDLKTIADGELYYTDKENGIPFLRVQNLSSTGILEFCDCKYINKETHENYLKRSQVFENDLLVKITGVGRMAVASVVPMGFEGNINQHIVVIKTKNRHISDSIAAFLNSDIGEKLASRRSTDGTRPALDYPALLSIPIINHPKVLEITNKVVKLKTQNDKAIENLLSTIDTYLLSELGIALPTPPENVLKNRMFTSSIKSITENRFDPFFHQNKFKENLDAIRRGKYSVKPLQEIIDGNLIKGTLPKIEEKDGGNYVVQINSINPDGTISLDDLLTAKNIFSKDQKLKSEDILVVITGATIGKISFWDYKGDYFIGGDVMKFQTNSFAKNSFVFHFLRSKPIQTEIKRNITGATNGHLAPEVIKKLLIPIPPLKKQQEIADYINNIRQQVLQMKDMTKEALKHANFEIENILINN